MKKVIRLSSLLLPVACLFSLASCSKVTEKYAEKINVAAAKEDHYTYDKVMKQLGDSAIDATVEAFGYRAGTITAYKGWKADEVKENLKTLEEGETVEYIIITIADSKAIKANYETYTK